MPQQQIIMSIGLWVVVIAIFYFLMIRPQKKKDKQLKEMRSSLSVGDKVITIGGIVANVAKVPFEKWAIGTVKSKKEEIEED